MESTLVEALVTRRTVVSGETVVMIYNRAEVGSLIALSVESAEISRRLNAANWVIVWVIG